ncbi:MAG: sle [Frankiales bacterium]|nr:sle [Frankiales bacterium]
MNIPPVGLPALQAHEWLDTTFIHWRYDEADVQRLVPSGLTVESYDGSAWVGLVCLKMRVGLPLRRRVRPSIQVLEANLRTYVTGPDGEAGVYFLSIDCDRWSVCAGGRALGVPYFPAYQDMSRDGDALTYSGTRYGGKASYDVAVQVGDVLEAGPLEEWLTGRFAQYSALGGARLRVPVTHAPWPLRRGGLTRCEQTVVQASGLPAPLGEPVVQFSHGVRDVVLDLPTVFTR